MPDMHQLAFGGRVLNEKMGHRRPRKWTFGWLVAAMLALGAPAAHAQLASDTPPIYPSVDENGVDVATGRLTIATGEISIGEKGPAALAFKAVTSNSLQALVRGYVSANPSTPTKYSVSIGAGSHSFTLSGALGSGTFENDQGSGSTFSYDAGTQRFTLVQSDGSVAVFQKYLPGAGDTSVSGRILTLSYPTGERLTFHYQLNPSAYTEHLLRSITSNLGYQLRFTYSGDGVSTNYAISQAVVFDMADETCDPDAASCSLSQSWPTLSFAGSSTSSTVTDGLSRTTQYSHVGAVQAIVTTVTLPSGRSRTFTRNTSGQVTAVTDGNGTWTYAYTASPGASTTTIVAPDGGRKVVTWLSDSGQIVQVAESNGEIQRTTTYVRDAKGRVERVVRPDNSELRFTYDARGNVLEKRQVSSVPGTPPDIVSSSSYPASCANPVTCNKPEYTISELGERTDYSYDPTTGVVTSVTSPANSNGVRPQIRYGYTALSATYRNASGTLIQGTPIYRRTSTSQCAALASCVGTADEVRTTVAYGTNDALQQTSSTTAAGDGTLSATTGYTYTRLGDVETVDGPLSGDADLLRNYYDATRRSIGSIGPDPDAGGPLQRRALRYTLDGDANIVKREAGTASSLGDTAMAGFQPIEEQNTEYNAQGLKAKTWSVSGGTTTDVIQYSYDANGRPECVATRMNPSAYGSLPGACAQGTTGSDGPDRIVRNVHDTFGQVTIVKAAVGTPLAQDQETRIFGSTGLLMELVDAKGNRTSYEYDGFGRRTKIRYPTASNGSVSSSTDYEQFGYDAASNVTWFRNRAGEAVTRGYVLGRLTSETAPSPFTGRSYVYDHLGRMQSATTGGRTVSFTYDAFGNLRTQTNALGTLTSEYDLAGNRTRLIYPGGFSIDYAYDATSSITGIRETGQSSGPGVLATFVYDNLGRRTAYGRGNGTIANYSYDAGARFAGLSQDLAGTAYDLSLTYNYNAADQLTRRLGQNAAYAWTEQYDVVRPYTANGLNQYTQSGPVSLFYDTRGNLTTSGADSFQYNHLNALVSATVGGATSTLEYDALGNLERVAGAGTTRFLYDGSDLIAEYDANGNVLRRYVHGLGDDEPLVWYEGAGTADRRWLIADEAGSIVAVTDAAGAKLGINSYDPFGLPDPDNIGRFQFSGQAWMPELGLYYFKARFYSAALGRFLQPDPLGYVDGLNLYAYVGNDPLNDWDPTGMCSGAESNRDGTPCVNENEIVVTGRRWTAEDEARWRENFQNGTIDYFRKAAEVGVQFLPGYGAYECATQGCGVGGWLLAAADFVPAGKLLNWGLRGAKVLARTGRLGGVARRLVGACGCLEAGTLIATPDGLRAIETLKVGDLVISYNQVTREKAAKPITALIRPQPKPLFDVTVADSAGKKTVIRATDDHPWLTPDRGWTHTLGLRAGSKVVVAPDGNTIEILSIASSGFSAPSFNLEVADWHTFLVGKEGIVTHNACPIQGPRYYRGAMREEVMAKNGGKCVYCSATAQHADHRVPYARGGPTTVANGDPTCAPCNLSKGAKTVEEWGGRH